MDWILEEVEGNIRGRIHTLEGCIKYHETKMQYHKDVFNTNDKFEVKFREYHRTYRIALLEEIKWLKDQLEEIELMKQEDVREFEQAEEDLREKRADTYI